MSGLLGTAMAAKNETGQLWGAAANREESLNAARSAFKAAEDQQRAQMVGTGAGIGAAVGLGSAAVGAKLGMAAGPVGALVGAGAGLLIDALF
ncbi:bacteriocin [Solimonas fluminis]|uniref:Bacteriocin n=1 Tax=Solimonas fluminis TaxID=2086571 RepID=A0A2S5THV9_9GAMM|nr:bacteriocin [Solimonas fluminis]PPE74576.1 bacteriocin [Solimonas fluminis]